MANSFYIPMSKKKISLFFVVLLMTEIITTGIILPLQENQKAKATLPTIDYSNLAEAFGEFLFEIVDSATDIASFAYNAAANWTSTGVALWQKSETILQKAVEFAWNRLRRMLLNMLVNDIVKWVQGGGSPRFITDWQKFVKTAADKAAGQLIDEMGLGFLCSSFSLQLRIALSSPKEFDETATCTLSQAFDNISNFFDDFSKGGWKGWATISESQNNYMGAYFMALNKKYGVMAASSNAAQNEGVSSAGFLGDKVCREATDNYGNPQNFGDTGGYTQEELPAGYECTSWETRTPGRIVGDSLEQAVNVDIPWIIESKEFSEYAGAIVDAVINRTIREGITKLTSTSEGTSSGYGVSGNGITTPATGQGINVSSYDEANRNSASISSLAEQMGLLKENINANLKENQTNLGVLNSILATQKATIESVRKLAENPSCGLPSGVSVSSDKCVGGETRERVFSISGIGSGTLIETGAPCESSSNKTVSLSNVVYGADPEVASAQENVRVIQEKISQIDSAIASANDYSQKITAYLKKYEEQNRILNQTSEEKTSLTAAETEMNIAKNAAISAIQPIINSSTANFNTLTQETMKYSQAIVVQSGALMTRRGMVSDCAYAISGTLLQQQCTIGSIASAITNAASCGSTY